MNTANYKEVMAELRTEYLEGFEEKFKTINQFFADKDWYSLELEYHKLKGTGSTYGVPEVSTLCEIVERICRENKEIGQELLDQSIELLSKIRDKYLKKEEFTLEEHPSFQAIKKL